MLKMRMSAGSSLDEHTVEGSPSSENNCPSSDKKADVNKLNSPSSDEGNDVTMES